MSVARLKAYHSYQHELRIAPKQLMEDSDEQIREDLLQKLVDARLMGPTSQIVLNAEPAKLPMREVGHGSYATLYLLYLAYSRTMSESPASRALFYEAAGEWRTCLKFTKKTVHQVCYTCSKIKSRIKNAAES